MLSTTDKGLQHQGGRVHRPHVMERVARQVLGGLAALYIIVYGGLAIVRITYPFELEFLEGTSVTLISRLTSGELFYVGPSLDFIPSNYTPFYYYLASMLALVTGTGFLPLRLISVLASLGTLGLIFQIARKETASPLAGLLAAGLFAASYNFLGAWYDLGRNDSLFLVLLLAGAYLIRFHPQPVWTVAAAFLIALSFFTKQTAAMIAPALVAYSLVTNRRQFAILTASLVLLIGGGILVLDQVHDGWFYYYVFKIAGLHPFTWEGFHRFWRNEIPPFFVITICGMFYLFWLDYRERRPQRLLFYLLLSTAAIGSSWMIRSHEGAYVNVLMPACAALALVFGVAFGEFSKDLPRMPGNRIMGGTVLYTLAAAQFLFLFYNPLTLVPTREDRQAGENLLRQLKEIPGEVWLTQHGYLGAMAGKGTYANAITIWDVIADPDQGKPDGLQGEILSSLERRRFSTIIFGATPAGTPVSKPGFIDRYYRLDKRLNFTDDSEAFRPITGLKSRPELIYVPH